MANMNTLKDPSIGVGIKAYPELEGIKRDAESLKNGARDLASHALKDGKEAICDAGAKAKEQLEVARERGGLELEKAESFVRANPRQSLAYAFVGGIVASLLLLRK